MLSVQVSLVALLAPQRPVTPDESVVNAAQSLPGKEAPVARVPVQISPWTTIPFASRLIGARIGISTGLSRKSMVSLLLLWLMLNLLVFEYEIWIY